MEKTVKKESNTRTIHRYHQILKEMKLDGDELDGISPDETTEIIQGKLSELRNQRTEQQVLFQEGVSVTLAGKEYEIKPLVLEKSFKWRERCGVFAADLFDTLVQFAQPTKTEMPGDVKVNFFAGLSQEAGIDMSSLLKSCFPYITGKGLDQIIDLLFLYSEELSNDEERIRKEATIDEIVHAAMEAFKIALPFVFTIFRGVLQIMKEAKGRGILRV